MDRPFDEDPSGSTTYYSANLRGLGLVKRIVYRAPVPMFPDYPATPGESKRFVMDYSVPCPHTGDAVFDDPSIRQQLNLEWSRSLGDNRERAGWIYQDTETGGYVVWTDTESPRDRCGVDMPVTPPPMVGKTPVRSWHTHIIQRGEPVGTNCKGRRPLEKAGNEPSPDDDIPWVRDSGFRSIVMDHNEVFTINSDGAYLTHSWAEGCRAW